MDKTKYCSFIAFVLILVTLFSWNSMSLSAKYVSTTPEICIFRNFIQTIIPTRLFISHVEGGTGATKKGTTLTLTPTADNQKIKVTITNPTEVVYYYSGVTSNENITLTEHSITKIDANNAQVTFEITLPQKEIEYQISFSFTTMAPNQGGMTNAHTVINEILTLDTHGLNTDSNPNDNKGLNYWCSPNKHYILVHDENQINGGNLKNILDQTTGVNFVMEYVTSNQYNVYLYSSQDSKKAEGTKIVVYKQGIYRENSSSIWIAGDQQVGWSAVQGGYLKTTTGEKTTGQIVWEEGPIP